MTPIEGPQHRNVMIAMRLHLHVPEGATIFPPHVQISTALATDAVYVFFLSNNEPVVVKDPIDLFPSDALINQLRLLFL